MLPPAALSKPAMTRPDQPIHRVQLQVALSAAEVDAGSSITATVSCACSEGCDLTGHAVSIRDAEGGEIAAASLVAGDDADAAQIIFRAPRTVGEHRLLAVLLPSGETAGANEAAPHEFTLVTRAHATSINVWRIPPAVGAGERFEFTVGVRCSSACDLGGTAIEVATNDGAPVATAVLGADHWPETAALHYANVSAIAPQRPGRAPFRVTIAAGGEPPHAAGVAEFSVNVVPAAEHEVTVTVLDGEAKAPIPNAQIVLHPYRAVTDAAGVARLRVAHGSYKLQVSGKTFIPGLRDVTVAQSMAISTELVRQPPPRSPDDGY